MTLKTAGWASAFVMTLVLGASDVAAQAVGGGLVPAQAQDLVVHIESDFGDLLEIGAGIVVGYGSPAALEGLPDTLYIVTARHVLRSGGAWPTSVRVEFAAQPGAWASARRLEVEAEDLDLAVLAVPVDEEVARRALASLDRRGQVSRLSVVDPVRPVGCPQGNCWGSSTIDQIIGFDATSDVIVFSSFFVTNGSSGGALFDERWEVVGMVVREEQPLAQAISIDRVLDQVTEWNVPVMLREPFVPRGGYANSASAIALRSSEEGASGLSGRITLERSLGPIGNGALGVQVHAGALRVGGERLAASGGVAGLTLVARRGRLIARSFVEGAIGTVEGRYDVGGVTVQGTSGPEYRPFFERVEAVGLGVGVGASLDAVVARRTMVQFLVGHWTFSRPVELSQGLPNLWIGFGLRIGG